jgi:hypothetical protein
MDLKPLSEEAIPAAVEKAKQYRLLSEPSAAESICRDILRIKPDDQETLVILVLAMCDQIGRDYKLASNSIQECIERLNDEYQRIYYTGISHERRGLARLRSEIPGSHFVAFDCLRKAMECYEEAEALSPPSKNDAILRWNTCTRLIERNQLGPRPPEEHVLSSE